MKYLAVSLSRSEKDDMLSMLDGCICRVCVSDEPLEIVRVMGLANDYIAMLAQNRMLQLNEKDKPL